mmetsp:Transcript_17854/g.35866  ORF Transcript_17854/g.35866 Transcript_17854/m.35866 type:complete len:204 (+) Transcript_17854:250-861(+)
MNIVGARAMKLKWFKKHILPPFLRRETISRRRNDHLSSPLQEIQHSLQAERSRLDSIKKKLDSEDYDGALRHLLSDTSADLHYFNAVKNQEDPRHSEAFRERHGKLIDFTYPRDKIPPKDCIWIGLGYRNKKYRCHNKSIICDGKELHFCPYHVKFCSNSTNHPDVPVKINCPNESALCNECFVLRYGHAPKQLRRIPGTKKI